MEYGILSLIPPILAITLAVITKNVIISLFISVFVGATILAGGNPILGFMSIFTDHVFEQIVESSNAQTMVAMAVIGGFVGLIEQSGGAEAFARYITQFINSKLKAQLIVWLGGIAIFFTDSGNSLILGPTFRPITDKLRLSREKLAFLVDATSAPVSILIPIAGWGVYIKGLIGAQFETLGIAVTEDAAFISAIPFQFYAWTTLLLIPLTAFVGKEFGPMAKAERKAMDVGYEEVVSTERKEENEAKKNATISTILIPLAVLFIVIISMLVYYGFPYETIGGSKMRTALCSAYLLAAFTALLMVVKQKVMTFDKAFDIWLKGAQKMVYILIVLVLAWSVGSVCGQLETSGYIISKTQGFLTPMLIPALLFVIGAVMAFATGTSWGTFAILMPIAIPMAHTFGVDMYISIGAVLSGGLFGDHCSPISDTTILSSMASSCDHIAHITTQIPYALLIGAGCVVGYLVAAVTESVIGLAVSVGVMAVLYFACIKFWGVKIEDKNIS